MTIDEAIRHCLDIADGQDKCAEISVSKHAKERISQCAADHRQLAEWLTKLKELRKEKKLLSKVSGGDVLRICQLEEQLEKAKRLLKAATGIIKDVDCNEDYLCDECEYRAKCDGGFSFYWRYADEALKLIGGETDEHL